MTTEEFFEACQAHDWFYMMSDDSRSYNSGRNSEQHLENETRGNPLFCKIYEAFGKHYFSGEPWKTPKAPMPKLEDFVAEKAKKL